MAASPFSLTSEIAKKHKSWGVASIAARQSELALHAVKAWPLNIK